MDRIRYMSIYSETYAACEAFDREWDEMAMEGVNVTNEVDKIMADFNTRLSKDTATFNAAYDAKKWKEAHAALDDIEKSIQEWKNKLRSIPDESKWKKGLKLTAKIAATVGAAIVMLKSDKLRKLFAAGLKKINVPESNADFGAMMLNNTAQGKAFGIINKSVQSVFGAISGKAEKHGDNKAYMAAHASLDEWIKNCKEIRLVLVEAERKDRGEIK